MRVLVVDDEADLTSAVSRQIGFWGHEVVAENSGRAALERQKTWNADLVLLDIDMPEMNGMEVLAELRRLNPDTIVIMLTGRIDTKLAVQSMHLGAENYITKGCPEDELHLVIDKAAENARNRRDATAFRAGKDKDYLFLPSQKMREVIADISRVASAERATVFIQGETGTGKEHAARLVHNLSPRVEKPFHELHCAALPENLLESELFGYEAGAFTDAKKAKPGLLEQAQGGTLFLDEVGELPLSMQTKLLKVVEDRQVRRLGGLKTVDLDVRLVAATNRDLDAEAAAGRFRPDLLYRLKVFTITMPPLRERPDDVEALARFFYALFCRDNGRRHEGLSEEIIGALQAYPWPGNIRELKNAMERLVIQANSTPPTLAMLSSEILHRAKAGAPAPAARPGGGENAAEPDTRAALLALLDKHRWNKTKAAEELDVSRPTFLKRLKEAGIQ